MKALLFITTLLITTPVVTLAGDLYQPLARLPLIDYSQLSIEAYINALYLLSISVAAILAVLKITLAGVKYVMSDIVTQKGDAKKDIQGALFGLLIVMAAVIILNTINRDLTAFAILSGASSVVRDQNNTIANRAANQIQADANRQSIGGANSFIIDEYNVALRERQVERSDCQQQNGSFQWLEVRTPGTNNSTMRYICVLPTETPDDAITRTIAQESAATIGAANSAADPTAQVPGDPTNVGLGGEDGSGTGGTGTGIGLNEDGSCQNTITVAGMSCPTTGTCRYTVSGFDDGDGGQAFSECTLVGYSGNQ
jgi:hypothetical protein